MSSARDAAAPDSLRTTLRRARKRAYLSAVTAPTPPLAGLRFALVGPGRVGSSLACWAVAAGARAVAVAGRPGSPAAGELAARLGARAESLETLDAGGCGLLLLALPDAELAGAAELLAARAPAAVALHTAGALGASVLAPLRAAGAATGSFHPLRAFPDAERDPAAARGTFFALDGDPAAVELGRRLAAAFGAEAAEVPEDARSLYHFAATLVAGGVATLAAAAHDVAARAGVPGAAWPGYAALARGALEAALAAADPADAITGPAARGDVATVERHLAALAATAPDLVPLAVALARATLAQRERRVAPGPSQRALAERLERADLLDRPRDRVLTSPGKA